MMKSWIRLNALLPSSPKVVTVARDMGVTSAAALGVMVRWLCWVDTYCTTEATGLFAADVDAMLGDGAADALAAIGWVRFAGADALVSVVDFDEYLSPTSKVRAQSAERVRRMRARRDAERRKAGHEGKEVRHA